MDTYKKLAYLIESKQYINKIKRKEDINMQENQIF